MPNYCPKCENEVLPYLKTGELKVIKDELISYQLYYCIVCKDVYYDEHERHAFLDYKMSKIKKEVLDAITSKSHEIGS
jgi:hypothetical protein